MYQLGNSTARAGYQGNHRQPFHTHIMISTTKPSAAMTSTGAHVERTQNIKLKYIEAQRIMVVLQELTRKIQLLFCLPASADAKLPAELKPLQELFAVCS